MRVGLLRSVVAGLSLGGAVGLAAGSAADAQPSEEASAALNGFIAMAADADIVILGEVHDNPAHHRNQAAIVRALEPDALVFEMIPQEREARVNELRAEGAPRAEIAAALDWHASGWPDFDYYAEVLEAAPEARVFGAGQPAADVRRAMIEGAAGPFWPDAAIYGLDQPLHPEEQELREQQMAEAHCFALPEEVLPGMVEAQRFRDAGIADAALWARTMTSSGQVVVITGNGHADRELGVPKKLRHANPEVAVLSLGQLEAPAPPGSDALFDYVLVTEPAPRDDACLPFVE